MATRHWPPAVGNREEPCMRASQRRSSRLLGLALSDLLGDWSWPPCLAESSPRTRPGPGLGGNTAAAGRAGCRQPRGHLQLLGSRARAAGALPAHLCASWSRRRRVLFVPRRRRTTDRGTRPVMQRRTHTHTTSSTAARTHTTEQPLLTHSTAS